MSQDIKSKCRDCGKEFDDYEIEMFNKIGIPEHDRLCDNCYDVGEVN